MCKFTFASLALWLMGLAPVANSGEMPADLREAVRAIGPVISPAATAKLYAPLHQPEPYRGVQVFRDEKYGDEERQRIDVFSPNGAGALKPVLIFVHGGGYTGGDKRVSKDSPFYDNVALWAANNGLVGVNMTYRLAPGYKWPSAMQDVAAAVAWARANAGRFGGSANQIILLGHSAGATHVAAYIASVDLPKAGILAAILTSGTYRLKPEIEVPGQKAYFGDDTNLWHSRSSLEGLVASNIPLFVAHGEVDGTYYIGQSEELTAALCAARRCPAHIVVGGHGHMSEVYSINTADTSLAQPLLEFIQNASR